MLLPKELKEGVLNNCVRISAESNRVTEASCFTTLRQRSLFMGPRTVPLTKAPRIQEPGDHT